MLIKQTLQQGIQVLKKTKADSPILDTEILLAYALKHGREFLFTYPEKKLTTLQLKNFTTYIKRRVKHEPVAYILGHKEFYNLNFKVNKNVLIPRPETELLVEQALQIVNSKTPAIFVDIGTGSGAIAITLAVQCKKQNIKHAILAIDNSQATLKIAKINAQKNGVKQEIQFFCGNLLDPIIRKLTNSDTRKLVILANLPYIPTAEYKKLQPEILKYEPRGALDGGPDGLKYYRELFKQIYQFTYCSMFCITCLCEIAPYQGGEFKKLVRKHFPKARIEIKKDLSGKNRVAVIEI